MAPENEPLTVERTSDREVTVTRLVRGPVRLVFRAWTDPELFRQWWPPKSFGVTCISCELDVRTGGTYRLEMGHAASERTMTFHGRYLEVIPDARIVWTNDEAEDNGAVTTATFEARGETTLVVVRDLYPTKEALDEAIESGATGGWGEQFGQLEDLLAA